MKRAHYSKHMLCEQDCVKFRGRIAWHIFLENNFADFPDAVRVKRYQAFAQPLMPFRYSNICYLLLDSSRVRNLHQTQHITT